MRALVLSGGGSKGSHSVGAIKYLVNDLGLQYDYLCGISVGALNACYMSLFPKGQEKEAYEGLESLWLGLTTSKIRKNWFPFGPVNALWLDSLYNSDPLIDMVHADVDVKKIRANGRKIAVGATSVTKAQYRTFTQDDDCFVDAVLASSSFPMGLCPIVIDGEKYSDGGLKHIIPIQEAIDFGATDIDVIACGPPSTTSSFDDVDTITYGLRCLSIMCDQLMASDLKIPELYNQIIDAGGAPNKKHLNIKVIRPMADLPYDELSFDNASIKAMMAQGYQDAKQQYKL
jgi:NTE family protein